MWKATVEQLKELKFVLNNNNSNIYFWGLWDYEFNIENNELIYFKYNKLIAKIESFEHFKQVMKILLTEKLHNSTWEDEIEELKKQIENL